jgi:hypothetical protein
MRRLSRLLLLALLVSVLGLYPLLAPPAHRIDQTHFDLIRVGMDKAEVEAIFGVPSGEYDWAEPASPYIWDMLYFDRVHVAYERAFNLKLAQAVALEWDVRFMRLPETVRETWTSKHGAFTVLFDHDQCVISMTGERGVRIVPPWQRWWKAIRRP